MPTTITVYVVWTMEDGDNVDIFLDKEKAEELFEEYGEFGCWEEKEFTLYPVKDPR